MQVNAKLEEKDKALQNVSRNIFCYSTDEVIGIVVRPSGKVTSFSDYFDLLVDRDQIFADFVDRLPLIFCNIRKLSIRQSFSRLERIAYSAKIRNSKTKSVPGVPGASELREEIFSCFTIYSRNRNNECDIIIIIDIDKKKRR